MISTNSTNLELGLPVLTFASKADMGEISESETCCINFSHTIRSSMSTSCNKMIALIDEYNLKNKTKNENEIACIMAVLGGDWNGKKGGGGVVKLEV